MTRRALLPLVLACGALAFAAPALSATPTTAWAKSANALCKSASAEIDQIKDPETMADLIKGTQKVLAIASRTTTAMTKLPRPAAQRTDIAKLIGYYNQQLGVLRNLIAALKANDQAKGEKIIAQGDVLEDKINATAKKLGASDCD